MDTAGFLNFYVSICTSRIQYGGILWILLTKDYLKGSIRGRRSTSHLTLPGRRTSSEGMKTAAVILGCGVVFQNSHVKHRPVIIFTYSPRKVNFNSHNLSPKDHDTCSACCLPGDLGDLCLLSGLWNPAREWNKQSPITLTHEGMRMFCLERALNNLPSFPVITRD